MPYVIAWSNTTPALSELANQTAPYFQNTKFAISERMTGLLVNDWTADPLVLTPQVLGNVALKIATIHPSAFSGWNGTGGVVYNNNTTGDYLLYSQPTAGTHNIFGFCPIDIPAGCTITGVVVAWRGDGSNNSNIYLMKQPLATPLATPPTQIGTAAYSGNTLSTSTMGVLAETVATATAYYFTISLVSYGPSDNVALQSVEIQYSTPDCRSTR